MTLQRAVAHLYRRTRGERPRKLLSLTGMPFAAGEVGRADKFADPYYGKIMRGTGDRSKPYGNTRERIVATEIVAQGTADMYSDPVGLAERDPALFGFVLQELHRRDTWQSPIRKDIPLATRDPRPVPSTERKRARMIRRGATVSTPYGKGTVASKKPRRVWTVLLDSSVSVDLLENELIVV